MEKRKLVWNALGKPTIPKIEHPLDFAIISAMIWNIAMVSKEIRIRSFTSVDQRRMQSKKMKNLPMDSKELPEI